MTKLGNITTFTIDPRTNFILDSGELKPRRTAVKNDTGDGGNMSAGGREYQIYNGEIMPEEKPPDRRSSIEITDHAAGIRSDRTAPVARSASDPAPTPGLSQDRVNALLWGTSWALPQSRIITYSFYSDSVFGGAYYGDQTGVREVSEAVKNNVRQILGWLETVLNIDFQEVSETPTDYGVIRYMLSDDPDYAYSYSPGNEDDLAGDVHLRANYQDDGTTNAFESNPGNHGYMTLIRETAYALGLKNSDEAGVLTPPPGPLPTEEDNLSNTVMSYRFFGSSPGTLMAYDLEALGRLYGTRSKEEGDTNYLFGPRIDQFRINASPSLPTTVTTKQLIWDTGGNDTLNFSALSLNPRGYRLDMNPGGWLSSNDSYRLKAFVSDPNVTGANITSTYFDWGTSIAYGVTVENIVNSSSADTILANAAPNQFLGYDAGRSVGADIIWNSDSNDTLNLSAYPATAVTQTQVDNDLVLRLGGNGSVTVKNYYSGSRLNILFGGVPSNTLNLSLTPGSVSELGPNNALTYTLTRAGDTRNPLTVNFNLGGTATLNTDYSLSGATIDSGTGTVTFNAGQASVNLVVTPIDDTLLESDETVIINLRNTPGYLLRNDMATGTIIDNDPFRNTAPIILPNQGQGNPYGSPINVSGLIGDVGKLTVTLLNVDHTWPDDLDILIVGPSGIGSILMSDAGGGTDINGVNLTFDSSALRGLKDSGPILSGTYRPTNFDGRDLFAAPAPAGPYVADLGVFNGTNPNGTWQLYVVDDSGPDPGSIAGGWRIDFTLQAPTVTVEISSPPGVLEDGSDNLVYTFKRTGSLGYPLTVNYSLSGTALDGKDYLSSPASVVFAPGSDTATLVIDPTPDTAIEADATVLLTLLPSKDYISGTVAPVVGTIVNDDIIPDIGLTLSPAIVKEHGTDVLVYTFSRNGSTFGQLSVNFTIGGTALSGQDYVVTGATMNLNAGTVTFLPGSATAAVIIDPTSDVIIEADETVSLSLSGNPAYNILTSGQVIGQIIDGDDLITGTPGDDTLNGGRGDDTLIGLEGRDSLVGGPGTDSLVGGPGNDIYVVDDAGDVVMENSGEGTDTVRATVNFTGSNIETIILAGIAPLTAAGDDNNNTITGNNAANVLTGNGGNDNINGNGGNDTISGGDGNDTLTGGRDADSLVGGFGNDTYLIDNVGDTVVENSGEGTDTVQTSLDFNGANTNIEVITLMGTAAINAAGDDGDNVINGNGNANTLAGNGGNDSLSGNAGNDSLMGGLGEDTLNGGAGADTLGGGAGNDLYVLDNPADSVIENSNEGNDTVQSSVSFTGGNVETITLTGTGAVNGTGDNNNNVINGNGSANTLTGNDGNDSLSGNAGNDSLIGGLGNDTLDGGAGADNLAGGAGDDFYIVDNSGDSVVENSGQGNDTVRTTVSFAGNNIETIILAARAAINATGDDNNNVINGNSGSNNLIGNGGNDSLTGNDGNDTLSGGLGNDTLVGGAGINFLTGGTGVDTFIFNSPTGVIDRVTDFTLADGDIIFLSAAGFGLSRGNLTADLIRSGRGFNSANSAPQRLIYNTATGALFFDADGNGNLSSPVQFANLTGAPALTVANFSIV